MNVALPDIQTALHSNFSGLQWIVDAYALSLAALLLTAGSLADMYGRRRFYLIGLLIFSGSSLLCGMAASMLMLQLSRAAGHRRRNHVRSPAGPAGRGVPRQRPRHRIRRLGRITGLAVAIGPLLGRVLTSGLSWRWIFFVNLPIGAAAIAISFARVGETRAANARRPDWAGFILLTLALSSLVFGVVNPPLASTAVGVVKPDRAGMASGFNSTFRQVGIATGIALLGSLFSAQVTR